MKESTGWRQFFIPKWQPIDWTWKRLALLAIALFSFFDALFVPILRDVDPGRFAERALFLIIGFRAVSKAGVPTSVLLAGACLAGLVAALNHQLLKSPSLIWTPIGLLLLAIVLLAGRRRAKMP